ncbi:MAG: dihydrolipoamide acetyltransferase family protein [Nitrospiraceae bacterium]|nr:dihydrolipoamide acetyltransferase family protein [Nitrospiraceae bacterium]
MPYEFRLPDLGEGITEAEIRKWLVKEGDVIGEHQSVLEVETDKAVVEVPSPKGGKVLAIKKDEGETAAVGDVLLTIEAKGEAGVEKEGKPPDEKRRESVTVVGELPEAPEEEAVLAAPAVREFAKEMGVKDINQVRGTGPGGSVTKEDIIRFSSRSIFRQTSDEYGELERVPLRGLRKTIAKNLVKTQKGTAFVTGMEEADVTDLWELREREKTAFREKGIHLTFLPFFIKAVQHALKEHPMLNASMDEEREEIVIKKYINMGIAVDTPEGLMVPVIKEVEKKTILQLAMELQEISDRARQRKISMEELKGNSFTITNYGHFGGLFATPIINSPDTAILGLGRIAEKPWVRNGRIEIRKVLHLSLTFDHRVTDGADASRFLTKIVRYLEDPALIFIESA